MSETLLAALVALLVWWGSTVLILYLDGLPTRTYGWSLGITSVIALAGAAGFVLTLDLTTAGGAYLAFVSALALWAWHELTLLTGAIAGPRRSPCPPTLTGWARARAATEAILHHELLLAATAAILLFVAWDAPNPYGAWTFAALWVMRLSTKLNLFLGARNLGEEFLPAHLAYLCSYMRRRPMNPLFPFSMLLGLGLALWAAQPLLGAAEPAPLVQAGSGLLVTLLLLGVLEHVFLMMPFSSQAALWRLGLRSRTEPPRPPRSD